MKRIIKLLVVLLVFACLSACSKGGSASANEPADVPKIEPIETPEHTDEGLYLCTVYPDYEKYTQYLEKADASNAEMGYTFWLDPDTNTYKLWLDNNSSRYFARAYIDVFDDEYAEEPVFSSEYNYLIRPNDYYRFADQAFDKEPGFYELYDVEVFELNYEKGLDYQIYYDSNEVDGYVIDAIYNGSVDDDVAPF